MKILYKLLCFFAALMVVGFAIGSGVDAYKYITGVYIGSAPLYVYILGNAVMFLLPCLLFLILGMICKRKSR